MKKIAVVALDPLAGASYTKEVRDLFGEYAEVVGYSVRDGSAAGVLQERICLLYLQMPMVLQKKRPAMCLLIVRSCPLRLLLLGNPKNCLRYHKERKCCL